MTRFSIRMGIPQVQAWWNHLTHQADHGTLSKEDARFFKKLIKVLSYLQENPRHNSLSTHEIGVLSQRVGQKVWQSYLENKTPSAGRLFWVYGPGKKEITIIAIEPHPEDKKRGAYDRIKLSDLPT